MRAFCRFYDHPMIPSVTFKTISSLRGRRSKGKGKGIRARDHAQGRREGVPFLSPSRAQIPPSRFNACHEGQTISNIKTLASVTPRISAISTSAVLFFVIWYHVPLVFPATRVISRDMSKTPERRAELTQKRPWSKAIKLTTLKTSRRLRESQNTSSYDQ